MSPLSEIAAMEEKAFAAYVLAPRGMKSRAKKIHAQWAALLKVAMLAEPIDPAIAAMSDDELLAELTA